MRLAELVAVSERIATTASRNQKVAEISELLRALDPSERPIVVAWLAGRLRQGRIGLGWSAIRAAADETANPAPTLFDALESEPRTPPTLLEADHVLERAAGVAGPGANRERARILRGLFVRASEPERRFLSRLILGDLRQGALEGIMDEAVARAAGVPADEIRRAAMLAGALEPVAMAVLEQGPAGLSRFRLELFQPVLPMLAQPALDLEDALRRIPAPWLEHKLDGARIQVHRSGDRVRVYTRQLNDVTAAVPEVVAAVRALPLHEAILDGEAIALDAGGRPLPFQVTMRRFGRTLDVEPARAELPLTTFLFDVLRLDGEDLLDAPLRERSAALRVIAPGLAVAQQMGADASEAAAFLDVALSLGHEGLMAKDPQSRYVAGGRGGAWLKIKPAHTLDLVVLAAEWGSGRRTGTLSNIHLGARDPERGGFVMLGKTFKGMTDEMLEWQTRTFPTLATGREGNVVHLRPELVVEVAFNDVQASPRYPGGMALRLARVKGYRADKSAAEADTVETVRAILNGQRARRP
jgi:DNA ligase-1